MGSLVPGWRADSLKPPKELQDFDEIAEMKPQGYFARLDSRKLERRSVEHDRAAGLPHAATIASHSTSTRSIGNSTSGHLPEPVLGKTSAPLARRSGSLMHCAGPAYDWEDELLHKHPVQHLADRVNKVEDKPHGWWARMDAGSMNVAAPEADAGTDAHMGGKFIPQYHITNQPAPGQHHLDFGHMGSSSAPAQQQQQQQQH